MSFSDKRISLAALGWGPRIGSELALRASPDRVVGSRRGGRDPWSVERPQGFKLPVVSSRQLTPTTHAIELEKPKEFMFRPTQFTFLQLLTEESSEVRPMSLATSPTRPHLEYAVRLSESPYKRAFAALRPGDEVLVFGPIGDFVLHETRPAILVAGGIGVTPLKGMAEICGGPGTAHSGPAHLQQPKRGRDHLSRRTGGAGTAECLLPRTPHAHRHCRPRMAGRVGPHPSNLLQQAARDLEDRSTTSAAPPAWWWGLREEGIPERWSLRRRHFSKSQTVPMSLT